jgi:alkyl sulfatase BDS1-like metallo-beta-lactamase superfamily hydrolase
MVSFTNAQSSNGAEILKDFHEQFSPPRLIPVGTHTLAAFGFSYANFAFIDTPEGIIVVDAGWFPNDVKPALAELRQTNSKPIIALIYTHLHTDHFGGSEVIMAENEDIEVYAPKGWNNWLGYSSNVLNPMVVRRGYAQMGLLLPLGDEGTLGAGIGIAPRVSGKSSLTAPTTIISSDTILNIGGLQVSLLITAADIQENMMIFLPEDRTLLSGDVIGGNFPYIATARFEPDRNPQDFIEALNKSLDLNPQNIVPGHGRILLGEEDVKDVLESNKDVIQFMIDQVNRAIINGLSPDEIIDQLKLPKKIAKHPDLQPHYHKIDWIIRQMFLKNAGFFGSEMDLAKLTKKQESIRMSEMLGGEKVMLNQAELAFAKKDYRWAASLSDRLLSISKDNKEAIDLRQKAFYEIAKTTDSANERNYLLTSIKVEKEGTSWNKILERNISTSLERASTAQLLNALPVRFKAENAQGISMGFAIDINGDGLNYFQIRNSVLHRVGFIEPDFILTLDKSTLIDILAKKHDFKSALDTKQISIKKDNEKANIFFDLME